MLCNDPAISYLKSFGYNVVRLPRADIAPLQLISRNGSNFESIGDLSIVINAGSHINYPDVEKDIPTASISGQSTSNLSVGIGLTILGNIIGAMGGTKLGLDNQYANAKSISFEFSNVLTDSLAVAALDKYLADADINPFSRHVRDLLDADDIFIITDVIKSNSVNVGAAAKANNNLTLDVPAIQKVVGANIKISSDQAQAVKITFTGNIPLVFGFKAVRLSYEDGRYQAFEPVRPGGGAMSLVPLSNVDDPGKDWLVTANAMINLNH